MKKAFFFVVAVAMVALMAGAFTHEDGVGPGELLESAWGRLTVFDAYFAILAVYFLTAAREPSRWLRFAWLVLYLTLGSLAIALYMLFRHPERSSTAART